MTDNIADRFLALPRGRRGDKTVIIVDEDVLLRLLGDAQAQEAELMKETILRAQRAMMNSVPRHYLTGLEGADRMTPGPDRPPRAERVRFSETVEAPVTAPPWLRY